MSSRHVHIYTGNKTAARDGNRGSKNPEMQAIIRRIHASAMQHSFTTMFRWRRRNTQDMQLSDDITKIEMCDVRFCKRRFEQLQAEWNVVHSFDGFDTTVNALLKRFYSDLRCLSTSGVASFKETLRGEDLWVHLPRVLIGRVTSGMQRCKALGAVLVPLMPEASRWPLVVVGAAGVFVPRTRYRMPTYRQ